MQITCMGNKLTNGTRLGCTLLLFHLQSHQLVCSGRRRVVLQSLEEHKRIIEAKGTSQEMARDCPGFTNSVDEMPGSFILIP